MLRLQTSNRNIATRILAGLVLFVCIAVPSTARALTVSPARIEISGDPGQTVEGTFLLINEQGGSQKFYTSAQNFEAQGETGTPNFTSSTQGLASWINTTSEVVLEKGEQRKVSYSITIPKDADAGGYFAAIFLSSVPPAVNGVSEVSVGAKIGTLILLRVSGEVKEGGGVASFGTKENVHFYTSLPVMFNYRFTNDGGDRINPTGTIVLRNMIGLKSATLDANPSKGNVLPGSTRRFDIAWGEEQDASKTGFFAAVSHQWKSFALGIYMAKLGLTYGTSSTASEYTFVVVLPWQLLIVMISIGSVVLWSASRLIKRYNRWIIRSAQAQK